MSKPTKVYALSAEDLRREQAAMTICWEVLVPLDTAARYRVTTWLRSWTDAERTPDPEEF